MTDFTNLCEKFSQDCFVADCIGAVIEKASYGYAKCSMKIKKQHCNSLGIPMGGVLFTLADFAFAVAANQDKSVVTQASQITFLTPSSGTVLFAEAHLVRDGGHTCFYRIDVEDDLGTEVAFVTINGYVFPEDTL